MYPYLPFDPKTIKILRNSAQKPFKNEAIDAWLFYRRISIYVSFILGKIKFIKPDHITLTGILILIIFFFLSVYLDNPHQKIFAAFWTYNIVMLLDMVDGELARILSVYSRIGVWMDRIINFLLYGLVITMGIQVSNYMGDIIVNTMVLAFFLDLGTRVGFKEVVKVSKIPTSDIRQKHVLINIFSFITTPTFLVWILTFCHWKLCISIVVFLNLMKVIFQSFIFLMKINSGTLEQ